MSDLAESAPGWTSSPSALILSLSKDARLRDFIVETII